jgi:putative endonuclease
MKSEKKFYVYILTNHSGTLYTGVTNDLPRRIYEHKQFLVEGFAKRYKINRLVHFEEAMNAEAAIMREKQIKGWLRSKKVELIEEMNPGWKDLSDGWFEDYGIQLFVILKKRSD